MRGNLLKQEHGGFWWGINSSFNYCDCNGQSVFIECLLWSKHCSEHISFISLHPNHSPTNRCWDRELRHEEDKVTLDQTPVQTPLVWFQGSKCRVSCVYWFFSLCFNALCISLSICPTLEKQHRVISVLKQGEHLNLPAMLFNYPILAWRDDIDENFSTRDQVIA